MKKILLLITFFFINLVLTAENNDMVTFVSKLNPETKWVPLEFVEVIKAKDRNEMKKIIPDYDYERKWSEEHDCWMEWYDWYVKYLELYTELVEYNKVLQISTMHYDILEITTSEDVYLRIRQTSASIYNTRRKNYSVGFLTPIEFLHQSPLYSENPAYYDNDEYDEIIIDVQFVFDGDYLTVYANNDKLKQVYFRCSDETFKQLEPFIYTNIVDLSKVTWPRHADGSCDYDNSSTGKKNNTSYNQHRTKKNSVRLRKSKTPFRRSHFNNSFNCYAS